MKVQHWIFAGCLIGVVIAGGKATAGPAAQALPMQFMTSSAPLEAPVDNAAFIPADDAAKAADFAGTLKIAQKRDEDAAGTEKNQFRTGRDARLLPGITLRLFTVGDRLAASEFGEMVKETAPGKTPSYWRVIPQIGRVWREPGDGDWSRAALPLMLVNDTENHAHQGLATFLYKDGNVTRAPPAVCPTDGAIPAAAFRRLGEPLRLP